MGAPRVARPPDTRYDAAVEKVPAVILAAGGSTRMGRPKALVEIGGRAALARVVEACREGGCAPVLVVVGADAEAVGAAARAAGATVVENGSWARGRTTSVKAALPHMKEGASIIGSSSVNSDMPSPSLIPYAATKAGIANMCASMAQLFAERGIRVNSVAPGPVWTPLIPSTMPPEKVENFGQQVPMKRPAQPAELAPVYVLLASDEASYVSGARVAVTGGKPIL